MKYGAITVTPGGALLSAMEPSGERQTLNEVLVAELGCLRPQLSRDRLEGYRRSSLYGGPGGVTVGTAVTISGAAANPNMGYSSSPVLGFLHGHVQSAVGGCVVGVSDDGQDGSFSFEDLGNSIRKIRIDFGSNIVFERIQILPNTPEKDGLCCAIDRIRYSDVDAGLPGNLPRGARCCVGTFTPTVDSASLN
jgi:hypothetical protein